ncbi:DUF3263 domain-containing protein [Nocardioides sp.]|uniref:DUF3263 domain-containing protein n=1 Tax=Nocardioides sp. TaxID=35761 RepID=UPI00286AEF85|nr:DUF3263 domain-containing protein [Nocardioides sp.]
MSAQKVTEQDHAVLAFERRWWKYAGAKETAVREEFGLGMTRYYQRLNWIIDQPEALQVDPMVVRRLQRLREQRAAARGAGGSLRASTR